MRTFLRAATVFALMVSSLVGPVSAATNAETIAQTQQQGQISGRVLTTRGTGLGGAIVTISGPGATRTVQSDNTGAFSIMLAPGIYTLLVGKGGYQAAQSDEITVVAGSVSALSFTLPEASQNTIRTIGRVSTTANRNPINNNVAAVTTLSGAAIQERALPNLSDTVPELPGVTLNRTTGNTANTFFATRGFEIEQRINIDGHPLASGQFGTWNTNYANSAIFEQVEVLKGAGLNGPTAGESAIGTINLRTRDFTSKNSFEITAGTDSYKGSQLNMFGSANLLNGKLSILGARAFSGVLGPWDSYVANRVGLNTATPGGTYQIPTGTTGLLQWQGDLSNRYNLEAELGKVRYRFSESTSITAEFLGLQGQYYPQGGAYAGFNGYATIGACANGGVPTTNAAACTQTSVYNPPYAQGLVGTLSPIYSWFPNSYVQNNEPQFSAELRTAYKNDTILVRPYQAEINRFINGQYEINYAGNTSSSAWYQIPASAIGTSCQVAFVAPTAASFAKGPCFGGNAQYYSSGYIGTDTTAHTFPTVGSAPNCTPTCYVTPTAQGNNGQYGYGTPFSQPEVDYLKGVTFTYIHPVGNNVYNLSYDFNLENSTYYSGDLGVAPAGCTYVTGSGVANVNPTAAGLIHPGNPSPLVQPNCPLTTLAKSGLGYAPTNILKNDISLTGLFQLSDSLLFSFGNYLTAYHPDAQVQSPTVNAQYAAYGLGGAAPVSLVHSGTPYTHYDPHLGLNYRVSPEIALRATAGSSITLPYASVISGIDRVDQPNAGNNFIYTLTSANPVLKPETQVSYDIGGDFRMPDGGVFSADAYNITIFDAFASNTLAITGAQLPILQGLFPSGTFFQQQQTVNVAQLRAYGVELSFTKNVAQGFGYRFTTSLNRTFFQGIPQSLYLAGQSNLVNGKQQDGSSNFPAIPYAKAYGEVRYAGPHNSLFTFGADYEGNNNSTYGPAYTIFNGTVRIGIARGLYFQLAGDNIFNFSTGTALGRALVNQGSLTVRYGCNAAGVCTYGNSTKSLQEVNPKQIRLSLTARM